MTPDQIAETYEVLAPMATDYANANIERAGAAQSSYGPLADAVKGTSQTAGIGNYTYNRIARPAVNTMRDKLIVEGLSAALNKQISDSLWNAQQNYNRSGGGGGGNGTPKTDDTGQTTIGGSEDKVTSGGGATGSPLVVRNSFTITDKDGNSQTYNRPENMSDQQWYTWSQKQKEMAEAGGKTFRYGS